MDWELWLSEAPTRQAAAEAACVQCVGDGEGVQEGAELDTGVQQQEQLGGRKRRRRLRGKTPSDPRVEPVSAEDQGCEEGGRRRRVSGGTGKASEGAQSMMARVEFASPARPVREAREGAVGGSEESDGGERSVSTVELVSDDAADGALEPAPELRRGLDEALLAVGGPRRGAEALGTGGDGGRRRVEPREQAREVGKARGRVAPGGEVELLRERRAAGLVGQVREFLKMESGGSQRQFRVSPEETRKLWEFWGQTLWRERFDEALARALQRAWGVCDVLRAEEKCLIVTRWRAWSAGAEARCGSEAELLALAQNM